MLTPEGMEEFKRLYLREYGTELTNELAYEYATKLLGLVKLVYGNNIPREWVSKVDRKVIKK